VTTPGGAGAVEVSLRKGVVGGAVQAVLGTRFGLRGEFRLTPFEWGRFAVGAQGQPEPG